MGRTASTYAKSFRERIFRANPALPGAIYLLKGFKNLSKADRHECNLCGYSGRFWPFGSPPRRGAACPVCNSKERHRLVGLWVSANSDVITDARVLHFAPEPILARLFRTHSSTYQSADLAPGMADTVLNIEDIALPDESIDLIVCSHVLEHVDDAKALKEMYRILRPGGRVLLMFPLVEGWDRTYENPIHTSHAERTRFFGQHDHVRMFGRDVRDRIRKSGFELEEFTAEEPQVERFGLLRGEKVFIATRLESS